MSTGERGYQNGYQCPIVAPSRWVEPAELLVGMGRFELPTPCSQIVSRRTEQSQERPIMAVEVLRS